jgi:hypothetical protein
LVPSILRCLHHQQHLSCRLDPSIRALQRHRLIPQRPLSLLAPSHQPNRPRRQILPLLSDQCFP